MTSVSTEERFRLRTVRPGPVRDAMSDVCDRGLDLARLIESSVPDCPQRDKAVDAVELGVMWATKAIAMHGTPPQ